MGILGQIFGKERPPSLSTNSPDEQRMAVALAKKAAAVAQIYDPFDPKLLSAIISEFESAIERNPKEWIYYYMLGDYYNRASLYDKAVKVLEKALPIRPTDPRSTYGLATALRMLTRAKYVGKEEEEVVQAATSYFESSMGMASQWAKFDVGASQRALERLGISVDEAAERAIRLFQQTLELGVRKEETSSVVETLNIMFAEFPHLEERG